MKKFTLFAFVVFLGTSVFAQDEEPAPKKHDATWHRVVMIDLKPGKATEASKIIARYESAAGTAGTPMPQLYWLETGSYDIMLIWDLKEGPSALEWSWSPDGVKWWKTFVAQEGSKEAAEKVQDDYRSLISRSTSQLMRMDK